ncbi:hypothetical protein HRG84_23795 [Flavisolibacter sp. BT320]|nr:hypothetical protein [Flavisolibacter longurius]
MKNYLPLALAAILLFHSCKTKGQTETNQALKELSTDSDFNIGNLNYVFDLPSNWYRLDTSMQGVKLCFLMQKDDSGGYNPIVNVSTESMHGKTHENYVMGTKAYLANNMEGIDLLKNGELEINGHPCLWFTYNRTQNGVKREMIYYSVPINGISYNITAGVNETGMERYKMVFANIIRSFRLAN